MHRKGGQEKKRAAQITKLAPQAAIGGGDNPIIARPLGMRPRDRNRACTCHEQPATDQRRNKDGVAPKRDAVATRGRMPIADQYR